ncbi:MAG: serine--tRNA ligase [Sphingobacteriales bacterium]|nr:MAG: serine--tRNA ligase [Sphingobacteriales bacterium]
MLQLNVVRANPDEIIVRLAKKNFDAKEAVAKICSLDDERKATQKMNDDLLAQINSASKEIGALMKDGKKDEAEKAKLAVAKFKEETKIHSEKLSEIEKELHDVLVRLPNLPAEIVPEGKEPADNLTVKEVGTKPNLPADAKPHWDLIQQYDIIDFELGNKITGAGFPVYKGAGAKLQRALISFFLDNAIAAGYYEIQPPLLINGDSGYGTGQLPDKDGQMYFVNEDGLYLIPTAEVPVTNIYRDVILKESDLPKKNCAYSLCFRREAGSYGKDVKGLNRLHQFDKVEIVRVEHPDNSYKVLDEMVLHVESLLQQLELPYRILRLCGGDMSFASALTYDFEVWSGAQQRWLEVSSVSNFETFQSNRMKLRFKDANGKTQLAHTLNGSALALPRIVASLLENNQTPEGIKIPKALQNYFGSSVLK